MKRSLSPRHLLFLLTGLNLFNYFDRFILSSVLEQIKSEFLLTDAQTGTLSTAFMLGYFLTCPIFGYLGDRISRKGLISAGILVWSLATFLTGYSKSYEALLLCRILVGIGEASYATLSPGLITDAFAPSKRNNALTVFYVAIPLGAALGTLIGSWIGANFGWHHAFIWAGAPGLLLAFSLLPFREPERGESEGKAGTAEFTTKPKIKDVFKLFKVKTYMLCIWGYVFYSFALGAYQHWGQAFMQRVHYMPQEKAGTFFGGTMVFAGLVGTFLGGWASTLWQKKNPAGYAWTLGLSVALSVPVLALFTSLENIYGVMSTLSISMLLLFLSTGPVNTVIIETVPKNLRASAMALSIFMIHAFGDLWSPWIVGIVSDKFGSLKIGLSILPFTLFLCATLWLWLALVQQEKSIRSLFKIRKFIGRAN